MLSMKMFMPKYRGVYKVAPCMKNLNYGRVVEISEDDYKLYHRHLEVPEGLVVRSGSTTK